MGVVNLFRNAPVIIETVRYPLLHSIAPARLKFTQFRKDLDFVLTQINFDGQMAPKKQYVFAIGIVGLLLFNLLQAGYTELLDDESYYWMYSQHLDWGYYDHPPMVAWMIHAGYSLFPNTIGVRLFAVLAITVCAYIMYALQKPYNPIRLVIIILSLGLIHFGGMLAVPDIPLVLFSAIYLWVYQRYLKKETWLNTILLGVCMAALLYSKYQGLLFIILCVLANIKLLTDKKFWIATLLCAILLTPHIYWQVVHGYPSLQFYIGERFSTTTYHFSNTTDYILGQLFLFGPLIGWMFFFAVYKQKVNGDIWIRTLKTIVIGVLGFFFLATLKGRMEVNWTAIAIIPAILLLHYYLETAPGMERVLYRLFPFSLIIIFSIRIAMIWNLVGNKVAINKELHNNPVWTGLIREKARVYPVYFINSYQEASKYIYYQHGEATSYNGVGYRNNQYDFWKPETKWFQDSILVVSVERAHVSSDSIVSTQGKLYCKMFVNPNIFSNYSFYRQMPRRKELVHFLRKDKK